MSLEVTDPQQNYETSGQLKILFVMRHAMFVRIFESAIRMLLDKGHSVHLGFTLPDKERAGGMQGLLSESNSGLTFGPATTRRGKWSTFALGVRRLRDYLRYLHPRYANAKKLTQRAEERVPAAIRLILRLPIFRSVQFLQMLGRLLQTLESEIPSNQQIELFIMSQNPDLVLVTPCVDPSSGEVDYIKSARALGISVGLCVASWDNLSNKGLIQVEPDFLTVWNDTMKAEAIELHGMPPSKVFVTGAALFDDWFRRVPSSSKRGFLRKVGLNPDSPTLLYLCSSSFVAVDEAEFVRKWISHLRSTGQPLLEDANVIVRPHPANTVQWQDVDLSDMGAVTIWPRLGAQPIDEDSKVDYFDSLYHSDAVVGVNTTGFIEAGIVGRPCLSLLASQFKHTQYGTLHFPYLVEGGLVQVAADYTEHSRQLVNALRRKDTGRRRHADFLSSFVRPWGLETECTPLLVQVFEEHKGSTSIVQNGVSFRGRLLRFVMSPLAYLALLFHPIEGTTPRADR